MEFVFTEINFIITVLDFNFQTLQNDFNFSFFVAEILNTTQDLKSQWVILLATEIYTVLVVAIGDFLRFQLVALCYINSCAWIILVLLLLVLVITAVHTR